MNESPKLERVEINGINVSIGLKSFNKCQSLSYFLIKKSSHVEIKKGQFYDCDKLETISIQCSYIIFSSKKITK